MNAGMRSAQATAATWTNGNADSLWTTTAPTSNWSGGSGTGGSPTNADVATFVAATVTAAQTISLNGNQSVLGLATNASNLFLTTLQGGGTNQVMSIGASGINHVGGGFTIGSATAGQQVAISLQGGQSWIGSAAGTGAFSLIVTNGVSIGSGGNQTLTLTGPPPAPRSSSITRPARPTARRLGTPL